ncbi:MAG: sialidase family protein, partial [Ignavibacteriaceae bacterium]|nr:sialidase family protein [Ignavibacteriaceae bacterium]
MKQFLFTLMICTTIISISDAQEKTDSRKWYQDPRMMNIGQVNAGNDNIPDMQSQLNYVNKNTSVMVQKTTTGSAIVYPNFRVYPSTTTQSEVPIVTHPTNKNIMYGSSNSAKLGSTIFFSEGVFVTTDGGTNWFGSDTTKAAPISDHGGDPAPSIDMNGRFYQSYLSYSGNGVWVTNSTDYGNTWAAATKIISGSQDKNHTFTINNPSSPFNGRTFVIWSRFTATSPPIAVSYTSDNGTTWSSFKDINVSDANHFS